MRMSVVFRIDIPTDCTVDHFYAKALLYEHKSKVNKLPGELCDGVTPCYTVSLIRR